MAHGQFLYRFFLTDVFWLAFGIGTAQPWLDANEWRAGFGPDAQIIEMRELDG